MRRFKHYQKAVAATAGSLVLLLNGVEAKAATWQETLQSRFDVVDTFDEVKDWTPGGQWYSAAGCATCASNSNLPKKIDGTDSIWGIWNNKGLSLEYTPQSGTFAIGDVITGATSGVSATVRRVWNVDGKWYIQLTNTNAVSGSFRFTPGERITSGTKAGSNLQWPLFIANHGAANTWRGTGKSLVMDIGDNNNTDPLNPTMAGLGAQRMGVYFGDGVSGKSGYKKVHAFFMMKVAPSFFNKCLAPGVSCVADGYDPVSVVKVFDLDSGFTGISTWGTSSERSQLSGPELYRVPEYGMNFSIFNFGGGGMSFPQNLFFAENNYVTSGTSPDLTFTQTVSNRMMRSGTTTDIDSYVKAGEWFGVEVASDIGTPGSANGTTDLWIYDKNGTEKGHYSITGQTKLKFFDHFYNKFVLGGNRLSSNGKTGTLDSRWWIDDVIIHGSRIGTTYFQTLTNQGVTDTTAPTAAITSPIANATASGITSVAVNATDNVGVTKVEFYANGALKDSGTAGPFSWDTKAIANGTYNLTVKAYDAAGNVGTSAAVAVQVSNVTDTTAPVVSIASPTGGSSVSGTVNVSMNATDNIAISKIELYVNGAIYGLVGTSPYNVPWNTSTYAKGTYTLQAKAYDAAGNAAQSGGVSVLVGGDATPPVVTTFTMPATATSRTVPVTLAATDAVGVTGYLISESSSTPLASAAGWLATKPTSFTFAGTGARTAYAWAKDAAGNVSAVASAKVTITLPDATAPTVTAFTMPATAKSYTVPITTFTGSDNIGVTGYMVTQSSTRPLAGAYGWSATPPLNITFSATGVRTAYAWVKDAAGNVSAYKSATVIVDGTAPTVTAFTMPATAKSYTVPITTFTGSDNIGVTGYMVTQSYTRPSAGAAGWSATRPTSFTFSSTGVRTAYAWVKDAAGNVSAYKSATVIVDGTAPVITSYSPTGGTYYLGATIRITAKATDAIAMSQMKVSVNSVLKSTVSGGYISYYYKPTTRGTHLIMIAAYDKSGNSALQYVPIYIK